MHFRCYEQALKEHYTRCLKNIADTGKAAKDVVGESYEQMRQDVIRGFPELDIATSEERRELDIFFGENYKADQYIVCKKTRQVIALEEDKGHYVDKCFAKRAIFNAGEVVRHCLKHDIEVPYFILSCPTNHDVATILDGLDGFLNERLLESLKQKFKFFPSCRHGRTSRNRYLIDDEMPFVVDYELVKEEEDFFRHLNDKCI